jgi:two-component system OmpR family response regulator
MSQISGWLLGMAKILVVDDEVGIREMLSDALGLAGFECEVAIDGFDALKMLRSDPVDLIICDINMPRMNGYELLERIREQGNDTPALMLTARQDRNDVTHGLKLGADDYVTKPFGLEELILRVNAILRRSGRAEENNTKLRVGPVELDDASHEVHLDGKYVDLSPTEFKLLRYLMRQPKKAIRKEVLLDAIWGYGFATGATVVDTYISYLRKKLHTPTWQGIKTIRGIGFVITDATEPADKA